ncbi:MAG TPA: transporter substrate-binding domain-containing protein, partial [Enterococcus aquimarinus]|nr:transporter substrate-binding domain-containing protein [Enterococcus aquimarinus]
MKKRFIFLSLFSMMLIGLFSSKQTVLAEDKTYQIGTDVTFAPFEFQNTDNEYVGIDIDLLKEIAADQQFEVNFRPLGFNSSIQGVISNQLDGMIAGMSITPDRQKKYDFSE